MFGWTAVTNLIEPGGLLLVLIIFAWTPPHFWALAIDRKEERAQVGVPMLPVTHGDRFTRLHILLHGFVIRHITYALLDGAVGIDLPCGCVASRGDFSIYRLLFFSLKQVCQPYFSLFDRLPRFVIFVFGRGSLLYLLVDD